MKHVDPSKLRKAQVERVQQEKALYLARKKHKVMKKYFNGIYSYPTRTILYAIGERRGK